MRAVLEHARYNDDAEADSGTVSFEDGVLTWVGPLPVDGRATMTYSVTIADPLLELTNVVTSECPGTNCAPDSEDPDRTATIVVEPGPEPTSLSPAGPGPGTMPITGSGGIVPLAAAAWLLMGAGAVW